MYAFDDVLYLRTGQVSRIGAVAAAAGCQLEGSRTLRSSWLVMAGRRSSTSVSHIAKRQDFRKNLPCATIALDTETITYKLPGQDSLTRTLDHSRDNLGRDVGWSLGTPSPSSSIKNSTTYAYGATDGLLQVVAGTSGSGFRYSCLPNSKLLQLSSPVHTTTSARAAAMMYFFFRAFLFIAACRGRPGFCGLRIAAGRRGRFARLCRVGRIREMLAPRPLRSRSRAVLAFRGL